MLFVAISLSDQAYGMMTLIAIIINLIMSIVILKKANKQKVSILYIFFLTLLFTGVAWWPVGIEYIYWLLTGNLFPYGFLAEINLIAIIISFLAWLDLYMRIVYPGKRKLLLFMLLIYGLICVIFFIYVIYYLHLAPGAPVESMLGSEVTPFIGKSPDIIILFALILLITVLITGLHFSITSMREKDPEIKWKGKILFISFIFYGIGEMDFMSIFFGLEFAVITRLILIIGNILFYIGFIMPEFVKKRLNLEE